MKISRYKPSCLEVSGDYACFTRPEMKVERVSYDIPTPSAVRAVFEAIFWKPAIRWHVTKIEVLNPIKWISVRRNEVGTVMSDRSNGILIEENRQQRAGLLLRDVKYRFHAVLEYIPVDQRVNNTHAIVPEYLWNSEESDFMKEELKTWEEKRDTVRTDETPGKYLAIFERRATKGQCFNQPYFGCREFSCHFRFIKDPDKEPVARISETRDLGFMLYDMDFTNINDPRPMFFRAKIEDGIVSIPSLESEEIRR